MSKKNQRNQKNPTRRLQRKHHLIDAEGKVLGRLATQVANLLRGKGKIEFVPYLDVGDYVVVKNAAKIKVTGKKDSQKRYFRHSGYLGGLKEIKFKEWLNRRPTEVLRHAVSGMLPSNKLKKRWLKRLSIYAEEPKE